MRNVLQLTRFFMVRRWKDSFTIGYNIIFPVIMIALLGYLTSGSQGKMISSYKYYALVMLPFCILMSVISSAYAAKEEAFSHTALRYLMAPISKGQIVVAKIISATVVYGICYSIVFTGITILFQLPFGGYYAQILGLLWIECFMVTTLGTWVGLGMKNFIVIKNILNVPICIMALLGGSFFPIGTLNNKLQILFDLSPVTWMNRGIFRLLYDGRMNIIQYTMIVLAVIGSVLLVISVLRFRKEEFLHGELPSYEK